MTVEQPEGGRDELADLRAEVEELRAAGVDWMGRYGQLTEFAREIEAERDDALSRLAEAEGVARTNAAWVQQQHAAAKEAREQRDAAGAQALLDLAAEMDADGWYHKDDWGVPVIYPGALRKRAAALDDAVEPADQPHPTPEADDPRPCKGRNGNVCVAEGCYGEACRKAGS